MSKAIEYSSAQREAICKLLQISIDEYANELLAAAEYYIERTSFNELLATEKKENSGFWAWYRNQFAIVDEVFLKRYQYNGTDANVLHALKGFWIEEHYPKEIVVFPPAKVLDAVKVEVAV